MASTPITEPARAFVEVMGLIVQGEGVSRIAGQIIGLLTVDDRPYSFAELTERLEVSRASISTNVRMLEHLGLIEPVAVTGERQEHFRLADNLYVQLLERQRKRMRRARASIAKAIDGMAGSNDVARARMHQVLRYFETQLELVEAAHEELKNHRQAAEHQSGQS